MCRPPFQPRRTTALVLVGALAFLGCDRDTKSQNVHVGSSLTAHKEANSALTSGQEKEEAKPIADEEAARELLLAWVRAQNQGQFEDYAQRYAARFTGVKRSGQRVQQQGRDVWMKDRAGMFKKPFTVSTTEISVAFAPGVAIVSFYQKWRSETYHDEGRKRLVLVLEDGQLRISREEMLGSRVISDAGNLQVPFEQAALAQKSIDSFVLLMSETVSMGWVVEHPRYISNELAQRAVSPSALPRSLRNRLKNKYEIFDEDGARCVVKPIGFQVMIHVVPHFGTVNFWEGRLGPEDEPVLIIPRNHRALSLWETASVFIVEDSSPGLNLGLEMERAAECASPIWGRVLKEGLPAVWTVDEPSASAMVELVRAARMHPSMKELDRAALEDGSIRRGERWMDAANEKFAKVIKDGSGKEYLYIEVFGPGGCGLNTPESIELLFRRQKDSLKPEPGELYTQGEIGAAIDLDSDGQVELISTNAIVSRRLGGFRTLVSHSTLSLDCGC